MKIGQYQELAIRTAKMFDLRRDNLVHVALGIGSEVGELCESVAFTWAALPKTPSNNIPEEIGDICWYVALLCDVMGWRFEELFDPGITEHECAIGMSYESIGKAAWMCMALGGASGGVVGAIKSHAIYNKPLASQDAITTKLRRMVRILVVLAAIYGAPFEEVVLEQNIAKLRERFPEKYSDSAAITRADKGRAT